MHAPSRGSPFISGSVMDHDPSMANFVIEVRDQVSKDVDHFRLRSTIPHDGVCPRALVSALLLLGFRLRGSDISHHIEPMWLNVGQSSGQLKLNLQADQPLKPLTLSELEQAMAIANRVGDCIEDRHTRPQSLTPRRWSVLAHRPDHRLFGCARRASLRRPTSASRAFG